MREPATVFTDLAAEVEIPAEGTLSRVLYRDDRVRVVIFAFDSAQELTEHTAARDAVILTLGDEVVEAAAGSWVHMPAHLPHSVVALEPSVMLLTMLLAP
jgi:quercetin dioxygenase-like cupin family protein